MKTKNLLPLLFSCVLFTSFGHAQNKIELMLIVATDSITQNNIEQTCRFEDQPEDTSIVDYLTNVRIDDEIKWKVKKADNNNASVKLVKFKHDNGPKFFNKDTIPAKLGRIKGEIVNGNKDEVEKYSLVIEVKDGNNDWQEFTIDPKLKIM